MYQLRAPHPQLRPFVENYWFVTPDGGEPVTLRVDVFVDARADLILNHGVSYRREVIGGETRVIAESNVDAQRLYPIRIAQHGLVDLSGVRFELGGLGAVAHPLAPLTGTTPPVAAVFGAEAAALDARLASTPELDERAALLDTFLLARVDESATYRRFRTMLDDEPAAAVSPAAARDRARLFARYLGVPWRTLTRVQRFQRALRALMTDPARSLAALASDCGYYDQAHFVREFRAMTGGVPRGYRGYFPPDAPADFAPNVVAYVQDAG